MTVTWTGNEIVPDRRERDVPRGAGFDNVPQSPSGTATRRAHCHTGLPREARCGLVSRRRRRPPACHRRGRRPSNPPPERLRRWDDAGSPKADQKAGDAGFRDRDSGRDSVRDSGHRERPRPRVLSRILSSPTFWDAGTPWRPGVPASHEQRGRAGGDWQGCDHAARAPAACVVAGTADLIALPVECPV